MRSPVVLLIIVLNVAVFLMWLALGESDFMYENFLVSWVHLQAGYYWTPLTSEFSHNMGWHILLNMLVLSSFGPILEQALGPIRFLVFYLAAAIVSSLSHACVSAFLLHQPELPALGASGAISGVVILFAFMFRRARIALFGIVPVPALIGALLFVGLDVWGLIAQVEGGGLPIGHGAHLGGALFGFLYFMFSVRPGRIAGTGP